jgi:hypothetical protein
MMLLGFLGAISSIIDGCKDSDVASCIQSSGISLLFVLVTAGWFGFLAMVGYAAQEQRSHRLAKVLMAAEALVLLIALFNAKHFPNVLGLITSLVDAAFAAWIITLAWRLNRAKGGRITTPAGANRPRRRPARKSG